MFGGVKGFILLLVVVVCSPGERAFAPSAPMDDLDRRARSEPKPRAFLEMLPPIGPIGIVAIVVVADMNYFSPDDAELAKKSKPARAEVGVPLEVRQTQRPNRVAPIPPTPQTNIVIPSKRDP